MNYEDKDINEYYIEKARHNDEMIVCGCWAMLVLVIVAFVFLMAEFLRWAL